MGYHYKEALKIYKQFNKYGDQLYHHINEYKHNSPNVKQFSDRHVVNLSNNNLVSIGDNDKDLTIRYNGLEFGFYYYASLYFYNVNDELYVSTRCTAEADKFSSDKIVYGINGDLESEPIELGNLIISEMEEFCNIFKQLYKETTELIHTM